MQHGEEWRPIVGSLITAFVLMAYGCTSQPNSPRVALADAKPTPLLFLTRGGCVNTATMRANLDTALKSWGSTAAYALIDLDTLSEADNRRGYPTPTLLYENRDVFGLAEPQPPFPEPT
jgi:hypothetical protein